MPSPRAERTPRLIRGLAAAGVVLVLPKCVACLFGYAALGGLLGFGSGALELCGAPDAGRGGHAIWFVALAASGALLVVRRAPQIRGALDRKDVALPRSPTWVSNPSCRSPERSRR
jgi:type IV secretory pathway TrbD component